MSLHAIIGQPLAVDLCRRWLAKETTHPLLFYGPEGIGKRTTAVEVAKALNCLDGSAGGRVGGSAMKLSGSEGERVGGSAKKVFNAPPNRRSAEPPTQASSCDHCNSCRKIAAGQHPDVRVVDLAFQAAERNEALAKQQTIRIDTVTGERRRLLQSPVEGRWKVAIFDDAHRFTPDAANVLLKILEEPPAQTAIILITPFRDRLFQTVLSRCQPVRFRPLTDEEMKECLLHLKVRPEDQMRLIELALGSPGRALHMNREEQIEATVEAEKLWQSLPGRDPAQTVAKAEGGARTRPTRADIEEKVQSLLLPATRSLRQGDVSAVRSVRLIQQALQQLRQNVQPGLVYDHLLIQLSRARHS